MNKKETIIPLTFIALSLLFIVVSLMVYLSKGKSKKWVARKMWIGGLLLSLSYVSCSNNRGDRYLQYEHVNTCYMMVISTKIEVELDSNHLIYGSISGRKNENYSYSIVNVKGINIQEGNIFPKRYFSEPEVEEFVLELNKTIDNGKYQFNLYNCKLREQDSTLLIHKYKFNIDNE